MDCKKIVGRNSKIVMLSKLENTTCKMIANLIDAQLQLKRPTIFVAKNNDMLTNISVRISENYKWIRGTYNNLRLLKEIDKENLVVGFSSEKGGFKLNLELAMFANEKLLKSGYIPLLILFGFEELKDIDNTEESIVDFYKDVVTQNTSTNQPIVFAGSEFSLNGYPRYIREIYRNAVVTSDYIAIEPYFIASNADESRLKEMQYVVDLMQNKGKVPKMQDIVFRGFDNEIGRYREALLIDTKAGNVEKRFLG